MTTRAPLSQPAHDPDALLSDSSRRGALVLCVSRSLQIVFKAVPANTPSLDGTYVTPVCRWDGSFVVLCVVIKALVGSCLAHTSVYQSFDHQVNILRCKTVINRG
jgi:hypothetical protein